jgi:hypothetical protein
MENAGFIEVSGKRNRNAERKDCPARTCMIPNNQITLLQNGEGLFSGAWKRQPGSGSA